MKKKIIVSVLAAATLSLGVFSGCFLKTVSIASIEKTGSVGLVDYYTITYTDGTTSSFTVTNGKDGTDAQDVTAEDVYNTYKSIYKDDEMTFEEFCEKYLTINVGNTNSTAALNSCLRSCLKVYAPYKYREYAYGPTKQGISAGSAVIYKMDDTYTYIVTNYHVVYQSNAVGSKICDDLSVYLYGSESNPYLDGDNTIQYDEYAINCEYIGGAISYDVAVLRAETESVLKVNPQAVPVKVNTEYSVGDSTYAIGNPDDGGISVTEGIVSVESDTITLKIDSTERSYRSIRTDTALTHGNSGGGLFNMNGELIGLNNAGDTDVTSMNYAIPATALTGIADGVIHYFNANEIKSTKKTLLGINSYSYNSRYVFDEVTGNGHIREDVVVLEGTIDWLSGQPVTYEIKNSLAAEMGLKGGDIITAVTLNGVTTVVKRQFQISDLLLNAREGDSISVSYKRGNKVKNSTSITEYKNNFTDYKDYETKTVVVRPVDLVAIE